MLLIRMSLVQVQLPEPELAQISGLFLLTLITALKKTPDWAVCLDTDNYLVCRKHIQNKIVYQEQEITKAKKNPPIGGFFQNTFAISVAF